MKIKSDTTSCVSLFRKQKKTPNMPENEATLATAIPGIETPDELPDYDIDMFRQHVQDFYDRMQQHLTEGVQFSLINDQEDDTLCVSTLLYRKEGHTGSGYIKFSMSKTGEDKANICTYMARTTDMDWSPVVVPEEPAAQETE